MWTLPQDFPFWLLRMKMCIHYALFACQNSTSYYNPGLKTTQSVGPQSNRCKECVQISRHSARALHSASERVPSTILCLLPWIFKLTRSPKRQSWEATTHSRYNGWKIKSMRKPGLEHDAVQTVWIWQSKGGVVGLNEAASVRVGNIRHPSIPSSLHPSIALYPPAKFAIPVSTWDAKLANMFYMHRPHLYFPYVIKRSHVIGGAPSDNPTSNLKRVLKSVSDMRSNK